MSGKRNRQAGHKLELDVAKELREELGYSNVVTCRSESRSRDGQKVDLMNKDERLHGKLPYNIQTKSYATRVPYDLILESMPKDEAINIIVHRKTKKANTKFVTQGEYAILKWEDLKALLKDQIQAWACTCYIDRIDYKGPNF